MKKLIFIILAICILCTSCTTFKAQAAIISENESNADVTKNSAVLTQTPEPTKTKFAEPPINPTFKIGEDETEYVFFSDEYLELYRSTYYEDLMVIPKYIVIHTDGQSDFDSKNWNTMSTYWGLGTAKSVHFAVCREDILQMLPMEETTVERANGTSAFWNENNEWVDYDENSIQIEMCGKNYNHLITKEARQEMVKDIEDTTEKTKDLVVSLMIFYKIPPENILGHYQFGAGKVDPGNLYFEEYFMPFLKLKYENLSK